MRNKQGKLVSIEPDDGYIEDLALTPRKTWEEWEKERDDLCDREWPLLFNEYALAFAEGRLKDGKRSR